MPVITGGVFIACGLIMAAMFHVFIVVPAFTPNATGGYGEIYGPVSFFRFPVYTMCAVAVLSGVIIIMAYGPTMDTP